MQDGKREAHWPIVHRLSPLVAARFSLAVIALASTNTDALSLGRERVESYLGQALRITYPIVSSANEAYDEKCFKLATVNRSDGIPNLLQAALTVDSARRQLIVRGQGFAEEPVIRLAIDVGCDVPLRREYVVLLDPAPAIATPVVVASESVAPTPPSVAAPNGTSSAAASVTPSAAAPKTPKFVAPRAPLSNKALPVAAAQVDQKVVRSTPRSAVAATKKGGDRLSVQGAGAGSVDVADAGLAALAVPRLKISSDIPVFATTLSQSGAPSGDELGAAIAKERRARLLATPIDEDIAPRLEADLVVAKRRLAEVQAQLSVSGAMPAAASAATAPAASNAPSANPKATATPPKAAAPASNAEFEWWWIAGALALIGGLGALFVSRRRQAAKIAATASPLADDVTVVTLSEDPDDTYQDNVYVRAVNKTASTSDGATAMATAAPPSIPTQRQSSAQAEKVAAEQLASPLFQLSDTESSVHVSELSHVTDEAQVFADLGLNDQAIAVLQEHITSHSTERPSPAVWLMLFDLLRRTNRRADYDALSPQFRSHFNGRMPDWESYGTELALDDGLEAFPHLVARIERDWATPDARKFLDELLYDNRGGSRLGFSLAAYRDLLLLMQIHDDLAAHGQLGGNSARESRGADDNDGTPKWDLSLDIVEPAKPGELEAFLKAK
ncbi:MAG: hypothetical protein EAZ43_06235 [Betaproteobacteria bacterium]|nr:MAG: hypothetical protein EAZ43_06235 [Betaproteobacteria bacterium]